MATIKKRECPREAFIRENIKAADNKFGKLRSIMKHTIMQIDIATSTVADVKQIVGNEFEALNQEHMLPFEAEDEEKRMSFLINRWLSFEKRRLSQGRILAKDFQSTFLFVGAQKTTTVHMLIERENVIEAIRFKYKAPEYNYHARSENTRPETSEELFLLQKAGETELQKLGLNQIHKPVLGAVYYLKSRQDKATELSMAFEDKIGDNIIEYHFDQSDAQNIEQKASQVISDVNKTCDEKECADCLYNDICHLTFEKRRLMEQPPVEIKSIDEITLTDAQLSFVSFTEGECRVNAVAGSGKTTIVALRTLSLIEEGCDPSKILMVTFSEKAKEEMAIRLKGFAQGEMMKYSDLDIDNVQIETFNSWGQHILDKYYSLLGFSEQPQIVDDIVKKDIIIELLNKHRQLPLDYRNPFMNTKAASGAVIKLVKYIDSMKAAHVETEDDVCKVLGAKTVDVAAELLEIYQEYNEQLISLNVIDFEDQLRLLLKLKDFGIFEQLPYEHIVVDEFQDSNPNQIAIIVELKYANPNIKSLVVVGDELQSIYQFRNATPENLVNFSQYFPDMVDIDLTANFRSQEPIIKLANRIIEKTAKLGKVIEAHKQNTKVRPAVREIDNADQEQDLFTRQVVKLIKDGTKPSDIAILCRTRKELIKQQMLLNEAGVPTLLKVPEIIVDAPYVKAIIALASFLRNHDDMISFALYAKSLGQDPFDKTALEASAQSFIQAFDACNTEAEKILAFQQCIENAKEDYVGAAFIEKLENCNFRTLNQYLNYCIKYKTYNVCESCSTARQDTDCVTLITVHSAKGLEWDTVLLSLKSFSIDSEASRLFYVGLTRAKERLLLTYTKKQQFLADLLL